MLSKDDIKAIRQADYAVPFYRPQGEEGPTWGIRFGKEQGTRDDVWGRLPDASRTVAASELHTSYVTAHGGNPHDVTSAVTVCRIYRQWLPQDITGQTPWKALRAGDEIQLHFVADNNSQITKDAGLHVDYVEMIVWRNGKPVAGFILDQRVSLNNSARMIQGL